MTTEHLHTYDTPNGQLSVHADGIAIVLHSERGAAVRCEDLGEAITELQHLDLDPMPVTEAAWQRILRQREAKAAAMESRDTLSLALSQAGVTHSAEVVDGKVVITLTPAEADELGDTVSLANHERE